MATQAQIDANRRNAANSTGPKTQDGKQQSRGNATTHGLTATVLVPQEAKDLKNERMAAFTQILNPQDEIHQLELEQAVLASIRLQQCQSSELERRIELAAVAADPGPQWDVNRQHEAACLGKTLKRDPEIVMLGLRQTPAGRAWLIAQWTSLLTVLEGAEAPAWSDVESNRALDLMGESRNYRPAVIKLRTPFADPGPTRALILQRIATLEADQQRDDTENARLRSAHVRGLITDRDAKLNLIRRYEREAQRCYDKNMTSLRKAKAALVKADSSPPEPVYETKPIPTAPQAADETKPIPQPGNRKYRRQSAKSQRHQAFLQRSRD